MEKYLYGAAVQGIQQFIFQSTKLKEIAQASALVEGVCKDMFAECLYGKPHSDGMSIYEKMQQEYKDNIIINAAGNVKFLFKDKKLCENVVRIFPKMVTEFVPGITISQAVVTLTDDAQLGAKIDELECKLREQRNRIPRSNDLGMMGLLRCRKTGKPAVEWKNEEAIDKATLSKQDNNLRDLCETAFGTKRFKTKQLPFEIEDIEGRQKWIAIIHADGNGLGQVVRKVGHDSKQFKDFSKNLDVATHNAVRKSFDKLCEEKKIILEDSEGQLLTLPIRPVVLGGDDVTVICRADLALDFVQLLSEYFEAETKTLLSKILKDNKVFEDGKDYLTLCSGIAFVKSNYPFHFGYDLAEELCSVAKKDARKQLKKAKDITDINGLLVPSCAAFHKVQDSLIGSYADIRSRSLRIGDRFSFEWGPYYLEPAEGRWTIKELLDKVYSLNKEDKLARNAMRQWLADMSVGNDTQAVQRLNRMLTIKERSSKLITELTQGKNRDDRKAFSAFDVMSLTSIYKQE